MERAEHRGVRRHRSEQVLTDPQVFDIETTLAPTGEHERSEHERRLNEDLAPIVDREATTGPGDPGRQCITEFQSVGERPERVQSEVGHHAGSTGFHNDATGAVSFHFRSALLVGILSASTPTVSPTGRAFPRTRAGQLKWRSE